MERQLGVLADLYQAVFWPERAPSPSHRSEIGGVKGDNMNGTSFARILLATACPGSPALWAGSFTCFMGYMRYRVK